MTPGLDSESDATLTVTPESGPRAGGGGPQENLNLSLSDQEHCR